MHTRVDYHARNYIENGSRDNVYHSVADFILFQRSRLPHIHVWHNSRIQDFTGPNIPDFQLRKSGIVPDLKNLEFWNC